jgi:hypothetical protein
LGTRATDLEIVAKIKSLPCREQNPGLPFYSLVPILTELYQLLKMYVVYMFVFKRPADKITTPGNFRPACSWLLFLKGL